jgi:deazaflavin-dependent oxidoreductase (nitroreductase family)
MAEDIFAGALKKSREIKISVIGRKSGKTITLPVWFVAEETTLWLVPVNGSKTQWFRNLQEDPTIKIKAGREVRTLKVRTLKGAAAVQKVVRAFGDKYKPDVIRRLYPGPLDVAVKIDF